MAQGIIIKVLTDKMPYEQVENFQKMISAKSNLIAQAFGVPDLPMEFDGKGALILRWFEDREIEKPEVAVAFVKAAVDYIKEGHPVLSAEPTAYGNPKHNFRVFLYKLGLRGPEHKDLRYELLKNLEGSYNGRAVSHPKFKNKVYIIK